MHRKPDSAQPAAKVDGMGFLKKIPNPRMRLIESPEYALRLSLRFDSPKVFHVQKGEGRSISVPQGELGAPLESVCHAFRHVEGDGDGP